MFGPALPSSRRTVPNFQREKIPLSPQIDLQKMPLGKLSKRQIQAAYSILSEVQQALSQGSSDSHILDLSNRFYTLIPHDFGMKKPPLLNNANSVQVAPRPRRSHWSGLCRAGCHSRITAPLCCDPRGQWPGPEAHRWALISK